MLTQRKANNSREDVNRKRANDNATISLPRFKRGNGFGLKRSWKRLVPLILLGSFLAIVLLHEMAYSLLLHQVLSKRLKDVNKDLPLVPIDRAWIAVVSLHRGFKFAGSLGRWLSWNKKEYAKSHGYAYADESLFDTIPEKDLIPLTTHKQSSHAKVKYNKLRFLLYLMEEYSESLQTVMWLDADTVVTDMETSIEDRLEEMQTEFYNKHHNPNDLCLVWAADSNGPNSGVMIFKNTESARQILRTSLQTPRDSQARFYDQASLVETVQSNEKFKECQLVIPSKNMNLLQSRSYTFHPGDWVLHLPNKNRIEILSSIYTLLK